MAAPTGTGNKAAAVQGKPPRDHHYIPQFYQRQWAGADGRVERYTRVPTGQIHCKRDHPAAVGYQPDLYRHPDQGMEEWEAQQLEWAIFGRIDGAGAKALAALLAGRAALRDDKTRMDWALFMRSMLMRTPSQMEGALSALGAIWRRPDKPSQDHYMQQYWKPGMPPTVEQFLETLNPNAMQEAAFRIFAESLAADRLVRYICQLPWRVIDCTLAGYPLLLSDHPVVLVPLQTDDGHMAMPLSPSKLLVIAGNARVKRQADGIPLNLVTKIMNRLTVERARHFVIASDRRQEGFIHKHFGAQEIPPFLDPSKMETVDWPQWMQSR